MRYRNNEVSLPVLVDSIDPSVAPGVVRFVFEAKARLGYSFPRALAENYVLHLSLSWLEIPSATVQSTFKSHNYGITRSILTCLFSG